MTTLLHRPSFSVVLAQLGRLLKPEPGDRPSSDPKFLQDGFSVATPDQILEMRYGRGRADAVRGHRGTSH